MEPNTGLRGYSEATRAEYRRDDQQNSYQTEARRTMARSQEFARTRTTDGTPSPYLTEDEDYVVDEQEEPVGSSYEEDRDWRGVGIFAVGAIAGALVGAGVALLTAPQSGEETRDRLATRARRFRVRADEGWEDLRDELRRLRRDTRRKATRGRWKVEDLLD
jgi:hypothetical protein